MTPEITVPLFCTNPACLYHHPQNCIGTNWYASHGSFMTKARGVIYRFHCRHCHKTFSTQSFSTHYWTHSTINYLALAQALTSASGLIQYCRAHKITYRVLQNRIRHLSRNCLALMDAVLHELSLTENLVFDGIESFIRSQMFPSNINIMAGSESQFLYAFTCAITRRKGKKTEKQKEQMEMIDQHWKPVKGAVKQEIITLFEALREQIIKAARVRRPLILYSDKHKAYRPAIESLPELKACLKEGILKHLQISSKRPRTVHMHLFSVNYIDRLIRKDLGEHCRETVKQGRELNCQLERMAVFQVMHNFFTPHRVCHQADQSWNATHADVAAIPWECYGKLKAQLFSHRYVRSHLKERQKWVERIWLHGYENPPAVDFTTGEKSEKVIGIRAEQLAAHFIS